MRWATSRFWQLSLLLAFSLVSCEEGADQVFVDDGFDTSSRPSVGDECTPGHVMACYSEEPLEDANGEKHCLEGLMECLDDGSFGECNLDEDVSVRHALIGDPELCGGCDPACFRTRDSPDEDDLTEDNAQNVRYDDDEGGVVLGGGSRHAFIANDPYANVSKVRLRDRRVVGTYYVGYPWRTGWGGNRPSRSAIDARGNAYIGSRAFGWYGYLTKIAGDQYQCIDRNRNGRIDTSTGGSPRSWNDDECVLWNVHACGHNGVPRAVTVDAQDRVWVGCYNTRQFWVFDSVTGAHIRTIGVSREPYGAAIDSTGLLWYTTRGCHPNWESYRYCYTQRYRHCETRYQRVCYPRSECWYETRWSWRRYYYYYSRYNSDCYCERLRRHYPWYYCYYDHGGYYRHRYHYRCYPNRRAYWRRYGYHWYRYSARVCRYWTDCYSIPYTYCEYRYRTVCETRWHWVYYCAQHIQSINTTNYAVGPVRWNRTCNDHYGIAIDLRDRVWVACAHHGSYRLVRYDPARDRWQGVTGIAGYTRGVTIDSTGRIWTSSHTCYWNCGTSYAHSFNADTLGDRRRYTVHGCNGAIGIGADFEDNIWHACHSSHNAVVLDPRTGRTYSTRIYGYPYTYSDFTGNLRATVTAPEGSYIRLYDSRMACDADQTVLWSQLYYDVTVRPGTSIRFYGRTANRTADISRSREVLLAEVLPDEEPADVEWLLSSVGVANNQRYFQVRVELRSESRVESPVFRNMDMLSYCICACDNDMACTPGCSCDDDC